MKQRGKRASGKARAKQKIAQFLGSHQKKGHIRLPGRARQKKSGDYGGSK